MKKSDKILKMYAAVVCQEPDAQIIALSNLANSYIPLEELLGQFKYCLRNNHFGEDYEILKEFLIETVGVGVVTELEAM